MTKKNILFMQNILLFMLIISICICIFVFIHKNRPSGSSSSYVTNAINSPQYFPPTVSTGGCGEDVLFNAYSPPLKNDQIHVNSCRGGVGVPVNVGTSSVDADYRQVGILKFNESGEDKILPLLGRPLFTHRDKWQFYTLSERNIKLPIHHNGQNGTSEYGCDNIYSGDSVSVDGYGKNFVATVYENGLYRYLPF